MMQVVVDIMDSQPSGMKSPLYIPEHFAQHRPEHLHRIIRDNPLGILVMAGESGMDADPIPFVYKETAFWNWN
ncbi:MAG: FMN-binding negative transcriptional regulator [Pseudomonas sp.]